MTHIGAHSRVSRSCAMAPNDVFKAIWLQASNNYKKLPHYCLADKCLENEYYKEYQMNFVFSNDFYDRHRKDAQAKAALDKELKQEFERFSKILHCVFYASKIYWAENIRKIVQITFSSGLLGMVVDHLAVLDNDKIINVILDKIQEHFHGRKFILRVNVTWSKDSVVNDLLARKIQQEFDTKDRTRNAMQEEISAMCNVDVNFPHYMKLDYDEEKSACVIACNNHVIGYYP